MICRSLSLKRQQLKQRDKIKTAASKMPGDKGATDLLILTSEYVGGVL